MIGDGLENLVRLLKEFQLERINVGIQLQWNTFSNFLISQQEVCRAKVICEMSRHFLRQVKEAFKS